MIDFPDVGSRLTRRDLLVGCWMLATMLLYYHNFLFAHSTGLAYVYAVAGYAIGVVFARFDEMVRHLLAIGTIGGLLELIGDFFLVRIADTLVYPQEYPLLLESPAYMPFAWALLIVFMGYIGLRLGEEAGGAAAYIGPAVVAFISESGFESLASRGGGWVYTAAPLGWIGHAPLFVVVAEALMFASVYYWARQDSIRGGIGIGTTIIVSYIGIYYQFVLLAMWL